MLYLCRVCCCLLTVSSVVGLWGLASANDEMLWKAGVASAVVTPDHAMWMAGYASRDKPSEGTAQDLFVKALALQSVDGTRMVFVTSDLISVPRPIRDALEKQVAENFALPPEGLMINCSHTHCGPELRTGRWSLDGLAPDRLQAATAYVDFLKEKLLKVVGDALADLSPARISYCRARCGFAMNRRAPSLTGFLNFPNPDGPVDHDVPVLKIETPDQKLRAVMFGYACHNTTLGFFQFCGDYAGFAQQYLEESHPGVTAFFVLGCGGDQNPYPRRTLELAQQHGRSLANAVDTALETNATVLSPDLKSAYGMATVAYQTPPTREELLQLAKSTDQWSRQHAERLLKQLDEDGHLLQQYDCPVQVVQLGGKLTLVALPGETVVDYSLRVKSELSGPDEAGAVVWVAGYSNDVFAYVPSRRVLLEGGYEAGGAMRYTTTVLQHGPFAPDVEERLIAKVHELHRHLLTLAEKKSDAVADRIFLGGAKAGEITNHTAIIHVRLASSPAQDEQGLIPGRSGQARLQYGTDEAFGKFNTTPWRDSLAEEDHSIQFSVTDLHASARHFYRVEMRPNENSAVTVSRTHSFMTAPPGDVRAPVMFHLTTCQDIHGESTYVAMAEQRPDFCISAGDTVYYDGQGMARNVPQAWQAYQKMFGLPAMKDYYQNVGGYFMKDDHDYRFNDADPFMPGKWVGEKKADPGAKFTETQGSQRLDVAWLTHEEGIRVFKQVFPMGEKTYRTVRWGKGIQVWMLENRDFRSPNNMPDGPEKSIWGKEQKEWLMETLLASDADHRIIISPNPIVGPDRLMKGDNHANLNGFWHEAQEFLDWLKDNKLSNVVIMCGDRHWQYHSVDRRNDRSTHEFSCGPTSDDHTQQVPPLYDGVQRPYSASRGGFLSVRYLPNDKSLAVEFHSMKGESLNRTVLPPELSPTP